jgi:adenylylsulfate kinase
MAYESRTRSVVKALSWRFLATAITATLVYVLTGKSEFAIKVGFIDTVIKLLIYFAHERIWLSIKWGQQTYIDYEI